MSNGLTDFLPVLGYVSIGKVFLAARVDPRASCAGTRTCRLFPMVRF